jgi:GNAT superfamily N-acetyltransferase
MAYPFRHQPEGCLVAERDGRIVGVAQALTRQSIWVLSMLAVRGDEQGAGLGQALLRTALEASGNPRARIILSSSDPRALTAYARAGFRLLPALRIQGQVKTELLPAPDPAVREGGPDDLPRLASISREVRGADHTPELEYFLAAGNRLLVYGDEGFAVVLPGAAVRLLAARTRGAATSLLTSALHLTDGDGPVRWMTAHQDWAIETVVRAGLKLSAHGALCLQGDPGPLAPYQPSGAFA